MLGIGLGFYIAHDIAALLLYVVLLRDLSLLGLPERRAVAHASKGQGR